MALAKLTASCPYCKEGINPGATRCKHCHADLTPVKKKPSVFARYNTFRNGFIAGFVLCLLVAIFVYARFLAG